ncbi:hypothetical protein [Vibrio phage vB_VpaP_AL-1]|nr:hypothetical protein [Vibrio phage vB_VpaP_AL-1]
MATLTKGYMNAQEHAKYLKTEHLKLQDAFHKYHNHTRKRQETLRDIYSERARVVGLSLVTYCKRFNIRGVLFKGELDANLSNGSA